MFAEMADQLKEAGLDRVNISLDSLAAEKFKYITRIGGLEKVKSSIFKALDLEMHPVKLNVVVIKGFNDKEILDFVQLAYDYPLHVRFIEVMPIGNLSFCSKENFMSIDEMQRTIGQRFNLITGKVVLGNGPAKYYNIVGGKGSVGFISPMSHHFCSECNRIRITADGKLRSCLYFNKEKNLKPFLMDLSSNDDITRLFIKAINMKPKTHQMQNGWGINNYRKMYQIGG